MPLNFAAGEDKILDVALTPIPTTATLSGRVIDADDGNPITGVTVTIVELGWYTNTDGNGDYAFANIPAPASYTIRFEHPDYETAEY